MRIIISPAKKMKQDTENLLWRDLPRFLNRSEELLSVLRRMSAAQLRSLWQCNEKITALNVERLENMRLRQELTPAILAYEGIQYRYMAPGFFQEEEMEYLQEHLRILSGFYGVLRPMDGVAPYRLEMQAKLRTAQAEDLYAYWGDAIAKELFSESDCIINLASKEYSLCVSRYLPETVRMVSCVFGDLEQGRVREKGTMCKMARGEMVRFMAEEGIKFPEEMKEFDRLYYRYAEAYSDENRYVFLRDTEKAKLYCDEITAQE